MQKIFIPFVGSTFGGSHKSIIQLVNYAAQHSKIDFTLAAVQQTEAFSRLGSGKRQTITLQALEAEPLDPPKHRLLWLFKFHKIVKLCWEIHRLFKGIPFDLIHVNDSRSLICVFFAAKLRKIPIIWHLRSTSRQSLIYKFLFAMTDHICFIAKSDPNYLQLIQSAATGVSYVPPSIDMFSSNSVLQEKIADLRKGQIRVLQVGCKGKRKNTNQTITFFSELLKMFPNSKLTLVGVDINEINADNLIGLPIELVSWSDDVASFYKKSHFLISQSSDEAFGRTIIESMAHFNTVIATESQGAREILNQSDVEQIFSKDDQHSRLTFIKTLTSSVQEYEALVKRNQTLAKRFATKKIYKTIIHLYGSFR